MSAPGQCICSLSKRTFKTKARHHVDCTARDLEDGHLQLGGSAVGVLHVCMNRDREGGKSLRPILLQLVCLREARRTQSRSPTVMTPFGNSYIVLFNAEKSAETD
jgi:hypothetical protein